MNRHPQLSTCLFCLLMGLGGQFLEAASCVPAPPGLVGWWSGDSNANDISGTNNPSTVSLVGFVPGQVQNGFSFGKSGYILIPSTAALANQRFTWAAWVRPDGPGVNTDGSVIVGQNINNVRNAVVINWRSSDGRFYVYVGDAAENVGFGSRTTFSTGKFYFVAATYDGTTLQLFVNGVQEGSITSIKTIGYGPSGWTFGSNIPAYFPGFPRTWNGVIDEIQAFNRALSISEIQSLYNAADAGVCKGSPTIKASGVVSASSFGQFPSASPGSWIEIYGANFSTVTRSWAGTDFQGTSAPTSLSGTAVVIGGQAAYMDFVSPNQINAQVPSNIAAGQQPLIVTTSSFGASTAYTLTVNAIQPGLLAPPAFNINGKQYVAALFSDGATFALPPSSIGGLPSRTARRGDTITLYGVGFGAVAPVIPAGQIVLQNNVLALPVRVMFGQVEASVTYAGLAPNAIGLYQLNVVVPNVPPADVVPLTFTLGGLAGTQTLYTAVQ